MTNTVKNVCPICMTSVDLSTLSTRDTYKIDCPRCGKFEIKDDALTKYDKTDLENKNLSVSYWINRNQSKDGFLFIDIATMRNILVPFQAPKPFEQANNLLLWMGNQLKKISDVTRVEYENLISIVGCYDTEDIHLIIKYLANERYLTDGFDRDEEADKYYWAASMTFKGWDRYYELQRSNKESRLAFMAMKFGNETLAIIFNSVIKEAVSKTGFEIRRLDEERRAGLIDDKLRVEIRRSKFLIADLKDDNNGAY